MLRAQLFVSVVMCCLDSSFCDYLITCLEESCQVQCVCLIVCDLEISTVRWSRPTFGCCAKNQVLRVIIYIMKLNCKTGM